MSNLSHRTFTALLWNFAGSLGNQIAQFLITLVLARLLTPAEFGLIAMLTIFTLIANAVIESGYGSALIQMQHVTRIDESSVFYFNIVVAIGMYGVFWFLAPPIAHFYHAPELTPITRLISLNFIFNAFGLVQSCLLAKRLDFLAQSKAVIGSTVISGILGIVLALHGYGVYSLVWQSLTNYLTQSAFYWVFSPWRPLWAYRHASMRAMFAYGSRMLASGLLSTFFDNFFPLLIGRFFPKAELGYYTRAQLTQRFAAGSFTKIVIDVSFPAYSSIQHDIALLREGYRKTIVYTSIVLLPVMFGLSAIAKPLFVVLFGAKWLPSVPYFQVLCFSGALFHLHALNLNVLKATGRSDLNLRLTVIKVSLAIAGALIAYRFGMMSIVWGQVIISCVSLYINTYYTGLIIQYTLLDQIRDIWPYVVLSAVSAALVHLIGGYLSGIHLIARVAILIVLQTAFYWGLANLFRVKGPNELLRRLKNYFQGAERVAKIPAGVE